MSAEWLPQGSYLNDEPDLDNFVKRYLNMNVMVVMSIECTILCPLVDIKLLLHIFSVCAATSGRTLLTKKNYTDFFKDLV